MLNPASPTSASCLDPTPENLYYPPKRGDYIYFETPPYQPGESPKVSLARAADASMLAYARFVQQRMVLADLQGILAAAGYPNSQPIGDCFVDGANTGRGYFASNDSHALLAFRGTEADNNNDKAVDVEIDRTAEAGALVHSGFKRYLDAVWPQVTQCVAGYRANHPDQNICITGHSLGGALATLAFTRLHDPDKSHHVRLSPRGQQNYCNVIGTPRRTRGCYRIVDNLGHCHTRAASFSQLPARTTHSRRLLVGLGSYVAAQPADPAQRRAMPLPNSQSVSKPTAPGWRVFPTRCPKALSDHSRRFAMHSTLGSPCNRIAQYPDEPAMPTYQTTSLWYGRRRSPGCFSLGRQIELV